MVGRVKSVDQVPEVSGQVRWLSDEEVAEAAAQDLACFDELYQRYADRIFRYALARTGSRVIADDVVGDVMVAGIESIHRFNRRRGNFSGWIFTIAHRKIVDHQRSRQRWRAWLSRQSVPPPLDDNALGSALRAEQHLSVRSAIASLPDQQREVILLRFVADLSISDICNVLSISEGAVKMRLNRALKALALELKENVNER